MIALLLQDRCTACQRCVQVCPRQVFEARAGGPPLVARAEDCQTCFACELYCQADALYVDPTVDEAVPVSEAEVRAAGWLGQYRRHSGWDEWQAQYPNDHWRMEEVFARGRAFQAARTSTKESTKENPA